MADEEPTFVVPLRALIEEASKDAEVKHLEGEIRSFEELLQPASLDRLASSSPGILAYLAFHPQVDTPVAEYVKHGSLGGDSGNRVLVLFAADAANPAPTYTADPALFSIPGVAVASQVHPSYEMIRLLFEPAVSPSLPGIVFFKNFAEGAAVYVNLAGLESALQVAERLRMVFPVVVESGLSVGAEKFADSVCVALQKRRLPYARTGSTSLREWFVRGCQLIYDHRGDIVAVAGLLP